MALLTSIILTKKIPSRCAHPTCQVILDAGKEQLTCKHFKTVIKSIKNRHRNSGVSSTDPEEGFPKDNKIQRELLSGLLSHLQEWICLLLKQLFYFLKNWVFNIFSSYVVMERERPEWGGFLPTMWSSAHISIQNILLLHIEKRQQTPQSFGKNKKHCILLDHCSHHICPLQSLTHQFLTL